MCSSQHSLIRSGGKWDILFSSILVIADPTQRIEKILFPFLPLFAILIFDFEIVPTVQVFFCCCSFHSLCLKDGPSINENLIRGKNKSKHGDIMLKLNGGCLMPFPATF